MANSKFKNQTILTIIFVLSFFTAFSQDADYYYNLAESKFQEDKLDEALKYMKIASDMGSPEAQFVIGGAYLGFYEEAFSYEKNEHKGVELLEKASNQGFVAAEDMLGNYFGLKATQTKSVRYYHKAIYWLKNSANRNNAQAQAILGGLYLHADKFGKKIDVYKAEYWYKKACKQNFENSCYYAKLLKRFIKKQRR